MEWPARLPPVGGGGVSSQIISMRVTVSTHHYGIESSSHRLGLDNWLIEVRQ